MIRRHTLWPEYMFSFLEDFLESIGIGRIHEADVQFSVRPFVNALEYSSNVCTYRGAVHHTGVLWEEFGEGLYLKVFYEHTCLGEREDDRNCDRNGDIFECAHSISQLVLVIVNGLASLRTSPSTYRVVVVWQPTTVS